MSNHRGSLLRQRVNAARAGMKNANKIGAISPAVGRQVSKVFKSNKAKKIYNDLRKKQPVQGGKNNMNKASLNNAAARLAHLLNNKVNTLKNKANKAAKNIGNLKVGGRRKRKTRRHKKHKRKTRRHKKHKRRTHKRKHRRRRRRTRRS